MLNMMMMTFMYERRNKAETWDQQGLVPRAVTHIEKMKKSYGKYDIAGESKKRHTASKDGQQWSINLDDQECECKQWQISGLPCVLVPMRRPWKKYCSKYNSVSSYVTTDVDAIYAPPREVRPPPLIRPAGRPRKQRRKDVDELNGNGGERKCGKCGMIGHNKKTCKDPPVLPQLPIRRPISIQDIPVSQRELRAEMGFNITNDEPMSTRGRSGRSSIRGGGR
ncbi:hypothetical protein GIB67_012651 [Kingdonia uniflora]|uniref:CCHC-type domain-containing protein n=1 Tax=Kingdonia uniflora TaxID=39325 RepID=A0A7J7NFF4_9MAGN|nr:hypothetical protein GIB67_012651 [Kingdonia uniflora]